MAQKFQRREFYSTLMQDVGIEVSSDGRTVWVNKDVCLARFCPISHEYTAVVTDGVAYQEGTIPHNIPDMLIAAHWDNFVIGVKKRWGVKITNEHRPLYVYAKV